MILKDSLNNLDEFWQRQVFKFETLVLSIVILWFKPITKKLETYRISPRLFRDFLNNLKSVDGN